MADNGQGIEFLKDLCGENAFSDYIRNFINSEKLRAEKNEKGVAVYRATLSECVEKREAELKRANQWLPKNQITQACSGPANWASVDFFEFRDKRDFSAELQRLLDQI
ncbi:hypothetical protein [Phaeobacter sp. J2-8]|uniref:hypothetical protein n=1 Tax=Phaeobacter sp. J2-8 TaxID=2931394 RepID=UPI001FD57AB9|nr:hypothetical protein [Phaeobacter sp. J2-8]MCJ7872996.1 hypothetical protein [Phaeobacter sp. J2-8]